MKTNRASACLAPFLLLSCALVPGTAAAGPQEEDSPPGFEPIRFGDAPELAYDADFFPGATYDPAIPTPDSILGQKHGTRVSHHHEVLDCFERWAAASDRVTMTDFGLSHEGRRLVYAVITSPANHAKLDEIRAGHKRLADPRGLDEAEAQRLLDTLPPVAWMSYSIHGDELSGTDAAVALGYHFTAGTGEYVETTLDEVILVIDPCQNPDGRERIISMVEQMAGYTPNLDYRSMHRGRWPGGRGNHYLFDMNRDFGFGSQPETRARWKALIDWNPHLFVDAHEMGSLDTYLFYPQNDPFLPVLGDSLKHWQATLGNEMGLAFDAYGWGYYTREWADGWGPFYAEAFGTLTGAVGILYEQASTKGFQLRRASGEILTYREAVHHHVVASVANLNSLRVHRDEILADYLAIKRENVAADTPGNDRVLAIRPGTNPDRLLAFQRMLDGMGLEYFVADAAFELCQVEGARGEAAEALEFPAGTWVVPARQPHRLLVRAFLDFDHRIDEKTLLREREDVERDGRGSMYDATSWSTVHAYDLDAFWGTGQAKGNPVPFFHPPLGGLPPHQEGSPITYAWIVDGAADRAVRFAVEAMELGLQVHCGDEAFDTAEGSWSRGSLLIRRHENEGDYGSLEDRVRRAALAAGVIAHPVGSGRAPGDGADLGGRHFDLLHRPRVALVSNSPISSTGFGHLWHHLDVEVGVPFTILDAQSLGWTDLRRYNVLVLPSGGIGGILENFEDQLRTWVRAGGTLVACGGSATALTRGRSGMSRVTLRRDALDDLEAYDLAVRRERAARSVAVDAAALYDAPPAEPEAPADEAEEETEEATATALEPGETPEARDAWCRRFSPGGANLLAETDDEHWLTFGTGDRLPISFSGSLVFLAKGGVETAVRFRPAAELRLAGLLWPEARARIADSAYLTRESMGNGQIILFAGSPAYRGGHLATARLFANAVVLGPGLGARPPLGW